MAVVNAIALILIIVGGLNWGLVGAFDFNLVEAIFGAGSALTTLIYILVGVAAIYSLLLDIAASPQRNGNRLGDGGIRSLKVATALVACVLALGGQANAEPKKVWELTGLKTPESAVADLNLGVIYVSNVGGDPVAKDGNGSISQVSPDGRMIQADWITGLDGPKGLALHDGRLYVADIDQLVEIDVKAGKILNRYAAENAKFLNDVAAGPEDYVYVSDMATNTIWRLAAGKFEPWLQSNDLKGPNGLTVQGDKLIVAAWGTIDGEGFATSVPGSLLEVSLADKSIKNLGDGKPVGNLDGLVALDASSFLVTDWVAGGLFRIDADGKAKKILPLPSGSADIGYVAESRTILIPLMKDNKLQAFTLE